MALFGRMAMVRIAKSARQSNVLLKPSQLKVFESVAVHSSRKIHFIQNLTEKIFGSEPKGLDGKPYNDFYTHQSRDVKKDAWLSDIVFTLVWFHFFVHFYWEYIDPPGPCEVNPPLIHPKEWTDEELGIPPDDYDPNV